ncbi:EAL domain-containing protein [Geomonas sp. Red69]|uniref:EAL domain-containing protein n=1 Tax=Geomonas diazotrophica TaxID=2843197 RepID=A0ABX8JFS5_9BACT|nr:MULTISPECIES: EAL domain-containing protein [Geomonas]MBU5636096.1 EAL domain-containing protein [Geomonas diazotrophica]QWV95996.1 EAL domain-containing protein [Geomonas nitrogeniifigens]QXE85063.1 EAL domain-containing protein [Geomonas nitrogeniifigens]
MLEEKFFLGRQPILDRTQQIMGFELLFRSPESLLSANILDVQAASASVIVNALAQFGIQDVLGRHKGFFNVTREVLMSDAVELLPKNRVVIELLESIVADQEVFDRCRSLKALGFSLALDDHVYSPAFHDIYRLVDIVKVDVLETPAHALPEMVENLRKWPLTLLAEKVENAEHYKYCSQLGFDLFQGYYFARPVVLRQNKIDIGKITMMQLMKQVMSDADWADIEETFKQNPGLTYNLLRLVNSVAMGLRVRIKTLRHALTVLGLEQLKRWITLALYACNDQNGVQSPLLEMAATRGKLMELLILASRGRGAGELADQGFMVGILSLIDVLFEDAMAELVGKLNLVENVKSALLHHEGELGSLLVLAELLEQTDFPAVSEQLDVCELELDQLLSAQLETFSWADKLSASL